MNKNPLTTIIIVFAIGDAYTLWEAITTGTVSLFTAIAWVQGLVLFYLYFKKSKFTGSYLFYSVAPIFPLYFGLKLLGLSPPTETTAIYFIAFAIYAVAMTALWKAKRDYESYIAEQVQVTGH